MRSIIGITLLTMLLLAAGCQPAEEAEAPAVDTTAEDVAAIGQIGEAYTAAENAGDAAGIAALYADNATFMPANQPAVSGKAGVQAHYEGIMEQMTPSLTVNSRETRVAGDIGYEAGTFRVEYTPKAGGDPSQFSGDYLVIAGRQADNSWKITNMIWNTDAPMAPMPAAGQ